MIESNYKVFHKVCVYAWIVLQILNFIAFFMASISILRGVGKHKLNRKNSSDSVKKRNKQSLDKNVAIVVVFIPTNTAKILYQLHIKLNIFT